MDYFLLNCRLKMSENDSLNFNKTLVFQDREACDISGEYLAAGDDVEVADSPVLRKLFPEKQALNLTELAKLVDADVLDLTSQQQLQEEPQSHQEEEKTETKEKEEESKEDIAENNTE